MIQLLGLLKNPFVKIIADKTFGAITHKLEKDKIIKAKEIEAVKEKQSKKLTKIKTPQEKKGLIGKNKNDTVVVATPSGEKNFEIIEIQYI